MMVYSSLACNNSQKLETGKMSFKGWNQWFSCITEYYLIQQWKKNIDTCNNMDRTQGIYTEWKKSALKGYILMIPLT